MAKIYGGGESFFLSEGPFDALHSFQVEFRNHLLREPGIKGRVLDVGCGSDFPVPLANFHRECGELDGVDPDPSVAQHPHLAQKFCGPLDQAGVPDASFDLAYAYNVAEHIAEPRAFFENIRRVLRPGGVFWALTPHHRHLFCWLARGAELAKTKAMFHRRDPGVNTYSSYYRMNSRRQVLKQIGGLGFREAAFHFYPAGWKQYFPRPLRWIGSFYDWGWAYRRPSSMLIIAYRLQLEG